MNSTDKFDHSFWRSSLVHGVVVLVSMILIVVFLPHKDVPNEDFEIDSPWMHETLIAKYDFYVEKSEAQIKHEQDSILKGFYPYYTLDPNIEKKQIARLENDYKDGFPGLPAEYLRIVTNRLHRIYQAGIMNTQQYSELEKDTTNLVRIIQGNSTEVQSISYIFSTRTAYEKLFVGEEFDNLRHDLKECNLNEYIEPNIIYDKRRTEMGREDILANIVKTIGKGIKSGEKIIDRGEIVTRYKACVIESLQKELQRHVDEDQAQKRKIGQAIFVCLVIIIFTFYLALFRRDYFDKPRSVAMLYSLLTIFPIVLSLVIMHNLVSIYIIPFCIVPVFVRVFMDSRTAFITHTTMILICAVAVGSQFEFLMLQLVTGMVAVYSLRELSKRAQVLKTAFLVAITSVVVYIALQLMQGNNIKWDSNIYADFMFNGVLILLSYPLMYLIEKMFGFTSDVTLFELSNTNRGALRDLSENAPGTFQHSITVGNLAAEVANKIGANSLLVRTGALYHDIGKMENPVFYTENQASVNPHDNMTNIQSAQMIISHVSKGISYAELYDLPQFIKDFILTHHGKGMAKYFYIKYKNEHPDEDVSTDMFTYPGPNPFTREQAILMMTDAVEAASRSLQEYTEETISSLVHRIIDAQVAEGYFKVCPITFRDISQCKQVLIERLKNIYHTRISYPEDKSSPAESPAAESASV